MRLSLNWLKDYLEVAVPAAELADRLTLAGLEVEAVEYLSPAFTDVVTARVDRLTPHPQADRLQVAEVFDGTRTATVVCGAPNVRVGGVYPFAPPGAVLAGGKPLKAAKLRGILSEGMLLAEDELGLSDDHGGLMDLPSNVTLGADLADLLDLNDIVLEVAITPNRADCLSILGLAREVAALLHLPLRLPVASCSEALDPADRYGSIIIEAPEACPRYAARLIFALNVQPSPFWLRRRLAACGVRAINNLVDVTNYIMLEYGQPLHAFDFDRLAEGQIIVRHPRPGEPTFVTLDGQERPLTPETLMICDARVPVAVAGVMGGLASEVTGVTQRVLLESAYFAPASIRRTAKRLGLSTEASFRFERGVDPDAVTLALDRASQLMAELGGGRVLAGQLDVYPAPIVRPRLQVRPSRVNTVLGTALSPDEISATLTRLDMPPTRVAPDTLEVAVPSFRGDIVREIDLIEEVARLHGFDNIEAHLPRIAMSARRPGPLARVREHAKDILQGLGFSEVINYSFQPERWTALLSANLGEARQFVRLANPLSEEQAVMRLDLLPGLLETLRKNLSHFTSDVKIFELAKTFQPHPGQELPHEPTVLAGLMSGHCQTPAWSRPAAPVDSFDLKGAVEALLDGLRLPNVTFQPAVDHPFLVQAGQVLTDDKVLGFFGKMRGEVLDRFDIKASAWAFSLDFDALAAAARDFPAFTPLPRYPAAFRDLAIVIPETISHAEVVQELLAVGRPLLVDAELFDVYSGDPIPPGQRSLAYHLCYRDPERTLTDAEVNDHHAALVRALEDSLGASLRA